MEQAAHVWVHAQTHNSSQNIYESSTVYLRIRSPSYHENQCPSGGLAVSEEGE